MRGRKQDEGAMRIILSQTCEVFADASSNGFGVVACVEVIAPTMEDYDPRMIRQGDAICVAEHIRRLRGTEAAVDDWIAMEGFRGLRPATEGAGAGKQHAMLGRRVGFVLGLIGGNFLVEFRGRIRRRLIGGEGRQDEERKPGEEAEHGGGTRGGGRGRKGRKGRRAR